MKKYLLIQTEYYSIDTIKAFDSFEQAEKEAIKEAAVCFEIYFDSFEAIKDYQYSDNWQCEEVYAVFHIEEIEI